MDNKDAILAAVNKEVEDLLASLPEYFLVDIKIKPTNNLKVFVEADGGISLQQLTTLNRSLYKRLEAADLFPEGDFSLEVSSPGLEAPLKLERQYRNNIGRQVEVLLADGQTLRGKLLEVREPGIVLEVSRGKGKQLTIEQREIPFHTIKYTKVCIVF
ncbi:ribosome maturation factor [Compostibacter hankyongensis]|uniref:Ribosome maturation factor RimP n=1 Tax=Compostibacter hankyongensis TaxID=1007089 RepID=A0ABP8G627_9BACT